MFGELQVTEVSPLAKQNDKFLMERLLHHLQVNLDMQAPHVENNEHDASIKVKFP